MNSEDASRLDLPLVLGTMARDAGEPAGAVPSSWLAWSGAAAFVVLLVIVALRLYRGPRQRALDILQGPDSRRRAATAPAKAQGPPGRSRLREVLVRAGIRSESAPRQLLLAQVVALLVGAGVALLILVSGVVTRAVEWLQEIPGGVGDLFVPFLVLAPWVLFLGIALLPVLYVRRARRELSAAVERDLPPALGLLATLAESGFGIDAGLERVAVSLPASRPLARELRLLRQESLAGLSRERCLRRMAGRLDVPAVSVFVSALVHAEAVGASVAQTLRRQAEDVWSARKEQALRKAQTLPTKLAVPLVVCFLPGLFAFTFGPALAEFIRIAEGVTRGAGG